MNKNIKLLAKAHKVMDENVYPGYPFQYVVSIDMKTEKAYVNFLEDSPKEMTLDEMLQDVGVSTAYLGMCCDGAVRGSFLIDSAIPTHKKILKMDYKDFYIDNLEVVKFYYALNSAIRNSRNTDDIIFACVDTDCDYVECQVFSGDNKTKEIKQFISDYFEGE